MNVLDEIASWAANLPDWQSDAVRRILTQGEFTGTDESEVLSMLAAEKGVSDLGGAAPAPRPLRRSDIPAASTSCRKVILKRMFGLRNVNALAPSQALTFTPKGITVVYGDNASGKSGYVRVLKRACRARDAGGPILSDVWGAIPASGPAEARFDVNVDGKDLPAPLEWKDGCPASDELSCLAVFDSGCARVYLTKKNEVEYVPYGLDVFDKLGRLQGRIRRTLDEHKQAGPSLPEDLLKLAEGTIAGKLVHALGPETSAAQVERLANLSQQEKDRLGQLRALVSRLKAKDPKSLADAKRRVAKRIRDLEGTAKKLDERLSETIAKSLKALVAEAKAARSAADTASKKVIGEQPLAGVGTDVWKRLYEAARRYSEKHAYPGVPFPATGDGKRCVFCQQLLSQDAQDRMSAFDRFLKHDTEREATNKEAELEEARTGLVSVSEEFGDVRQDSLDELKELNGPVAGRLTDYLATAEKRTKALTSAVETDSWQRTPSLGDSPAVELGAVAKAQEDEADQLEKSARPTEQAKLEAELQELEARATLASHIGAVKAQIETMLRNGKLDACIDSLGTAELSRQNRKLLEAAVSQALRDALKEEREALGVGHVKVALSKTVREGRPMHQLELDGTVCECEDVSRVLSEGEQRAISIASFLAELKVSGHPSGIVFDDPVSSLDHKWRERAARRLAKEGQVRQVIVFTHDVVFLVAMVREAGRIGTPVETQTVKVGPNGKGVIEPGALPWPVKRVKERLGALGQDLSGARREYKNGETDEYRKAVLDFAIRLRKTWERAVEECLFNGVIERFGDQVKTRSLDVVEVTDDEYKAVRVNYGRCSDLLHDAADVRQASLPTPDDLRTALEELEAFVKEVKKQRKKTSKRRKNALVPPPAQTP